MLARTAGNNGSNEQMNDRATTAFHNNIMIKIDGLMIPCAPPSTTVYCPGENNDANEQIK